MVQRHLLSAVQQTVHSSVNADKLTVMCEVSSNDLATEGIVRTFYWKERAVGVVLGNFASADNLLTELVGTLN